MADRTTVCRIGLWLLALACMPSVCAAGIRYDVVDLGSGIATAINRHGEVVGYVGSWAASWYYHPSTGREGIPNSRGSPVHYQQWARDISDSGIIVGQNGGSSFTYDIRARVFLGATGSGFESINFLELSADTVEQLLLRNGRHSV